LVLATQKGGGMTGRGTNCPACGGPLEPKPAIRSVDRLHGVPGEFEVRVCLVCGSGRTFPQAGPDELGRFYPEAYDAYSLPAGGVAHLLAVALYRWHYHWLLRRRPFSALEKPGRLLDVGAGRGDLGVVLASRGWDVTGLEPSAKACEEGRRRGLTMVQGTLGNTELGGGYDAVVFQHALEHVAEPRDDLARAVELLRPGGLLLVALPNFGSWQARRFGKAWFHLDVPRHRSHFTAAGLERLLRTAGLEQIELSTATTADGLENSLQYRLWGRRRFRSGIPRYLWTALSLALQPLIALVQAGGDELGASARR
jgi:SAM-dependent methyltransferase